MEVSQLIRKLEKIDASLPVMHQCDHGQWPEEIFCIETLWRVVSSLDSNYTDLIYGTLEELLEDYDQDELEQFVMIY